MTGNPFDTRSPYEAVGNLRRQRMMIALSRSVIYVTVPIIVLYGVMLLLAPSWQILITLVDVILFLPLSFLCIWLAQRDRTEIASYIQINTLTVILGINSTLIANLDMLVAPALILLIVMAGMLLGPKESYIAAGVAMAVWVASQLLLVNGIAQPVTLPEPWGGWSNWVIMGLIFIFASLLSLYATRDLRMALNDATYDLVQANSELEKASQLKTQFTARTSHELRTPLSAIIVFTDLALRRAYGPLTEKQEDSLRRVLLSAKRLHALIEDILDISKIEAGELELNEEAFPVSKLADTLQATLDASAQEKKLEFGVTLSPEMPPEIVGDEKRLSQILINLSHNAIKFTEKGSVQVTIAPLNGTQWHMMVQDTGRGIHEKNFETIFEAFRQEVVAANEAGTKGTGLGLAITRQLVQMMNGEINLTSQLGKGSTFDVILPLRLPETQVSAVTESGGH
jgi:signal transduction histidine kinase